MKADINVKNEETGFNSLHYAVLNNNIPLISMLIKHGININDQSKSHYTPLIIACDKGNLKVIEILA